MCDSSFRFVFPSRKRDCAFTLAELLIALAILGVIATFTIPKLLHSQQSQQYQSSAKDVVASIAGAYMAYKQANDGQAPSDTEFADLLPYLNYVSTDTTSFIDDYDLGSGNRGCDFSNGTCIRPHTGGVLMYRPGSSFGGTATTNAIWFLYDPDGRDSSIAGLSGILLYNGRILTSSGAAPVYHSSENHYSDWEEPAWFSWD